MRMICFGSGSSGNCYYLESQDQAILIDLGIGIRTFRKYLSDYGLAIPTIRAILVTHDHTDHIKAIGPFSQKFNIPVYATQRTHDGIVRNRMMNKKIPSECKRYVVAYESFEVGNFRITPFPVSHDAWGGNTGYFVEEITPTTLSENLFDCSTSPNKVNFCLITDCGRFEDHLIPYVAQADYLVIEANYDKEMLLKGPYPYYLQQRIQCGTGHLANHETAAALIRALSPRTKHIWLCHLSAENNRPQKALDCVAQALTALDFTPIPKVEALRRTVPNGPYELL